MQMPFVHEIEGVTGTKRLNVLLHKFFYQSLLIVSPGTDYVPAFLITHK